METQVLSPSSGVLVVGCGHVGGELIKEIAGLKPFGLDPKKGIYPPTWFKEDITFICVPTDMQSDGSSDISNVEEAVKNSQANIIVIKSAIPVGTSEALMTKYNKRIVVSPEYWGNNLHALKSPDFLVLGGDKDDCQKVAELYYKIKPSINFKIIYTTNKTAELAKYMENCFLALKVTFCNEFADIARSYGISYPELRECFIADPRMGASHTFVYPDKPFYDSHCLNKDIPALINFSDKAPLMKAMHEINKMRKEGIK